MQIHPNGAGRPVVRAFRQQRVDHQQVGVTARWHLLEEVTGDEQDASRLRHGTEDGGQQDPAPSADVDDGAVGTEVVRRDDVTASATARPAIEASNAA